MRPGHKQRITQVVTLIERKIGNKSARHYLAYARCFGLDPQGCFSGNLNLKSYWGNFEGKIGPSYLVHVELNAIESAVAETLHMHNDIVSAWRQQDETV